MKDSPVSILSRAAWSLESRPLRLVALMILAFMATEWPPAGQAQSIYSNPIEGTNPNTANPYTTGQVVNSNITVSGISRGAGAAGTNANNRYNANSWNTTSIDTTAYFSWTLTPKTGFEIDFTSLTGKWQRSATGPTPFQLSYSLDGFATSTLITTGSITGSATEESFSITLDMPSLDSITSAIEFRFYAWGTTNSGGTFSINEFFFNGTVDTIVVPTTGNYWDTNGSTAGVGGTGTWSTDGTTWNTQAGTGTPVAFDRTQEVAFGGTAGTVTLSDTVSHESNLRFEVTGYTLQGGILELVPSSGSPVITVATAGHVATIDSEISGSSGLIKAGAGTLVLGGINTFAGDVAVNAGVLEVEADENLGYVDNDVILGGGTLKTTATIMLDGGRNLSGSGTLDVAAGTTLTVGGSVNATALTLSNSGVVVLDGATDTETYALGALTLTGDAVVQGDNATVANITAGHTGTASVANNLDFGAVDRTVTVSNAAAVLVLGGDLTGTRIIKSGAGTLEATGDNAAMTSGFQLGASAATPTNGGTLKIGHKNGLGTGAQSQFRFNYGVLSATTALTGENALENSLSIGGRTGAAAEFAGGDMEINGTVGFFLAASTSGQLVLNTSNTTTLNGDRTTDLVLGSGGTLGSATGITLGGTGKLVLNGNWSSNTRAVTLAQSVTTEINNLFTGNITVGDGVASGGTTPTLQGHGTLTGVVTVNSDGRLKIGSTGDTAARVMTISGNLTSSGTLEFDLFSGGAGGTEGSADKLAFGGGTTSVNLSGTLVINNADLNFGADPWEDGTFWQLIDWGSVLEANRTLGFTTVTLPEIAGYEWINTLSTDGRITLSAVPEPGRLVLLLLGGGLLLVQRRRKPAAPAAPAAAGV